MDCVIGNKMPGRDERSVLLLISIRIPGGPATQPDYFDSISQLPLLETPISLFYVSVTIFEIFFWTKLTISLFIISVDGGWGEWSEWSQCAHTGEGAQGDRCSCRQRSCDRPAPANGGGQCLGHSHEVTNCTRHGGWTEWSAWSACSQTCGLAVKTRRRSCGNPEPAFGGRLCVGPDRDEIYCPTNPPCPVKSVPPVDGQWSDWSDWTECTASCGGGFRSRQRRCDSPPVQHGGAGKKTKSVFSSSFSSLYDGCP